MTIRHSITAVLSSVLLALGLSLVVVVPAHASASGTVDCANGQAIQGIWIEAANPAKRGWATRWSIGGTSYRNGWSFAALNPGDSYQINVGCGSWSPTYTSTQATYHSGNFICIPSAQGVSNRCWDS